MCNRAMKTQNGPKFSVISSRRHPSGRRDGSRPRVCDPTCPPTRNAYDFAKESVVAVAGPGYPLERNKLRKGLRIIHTEWVRNTLAPTQDSGVSDDPDDFEPGQSHPQPDLDLTEDNRILCTQNTDRD
jgi:hypothetical protein